MESVGIHKRVVNGVTVFPKVNTMKRKNPDTVKRVISAIEKHLESHPTDAMSRNHLENLRRLA